MKNHAAMRVALYGVTTYCHLSCQIRNVALCEGDVIFVFKSFYIHNSALAVRLMGDVMYYVNHKLYWHLLYPSKTKMVLYECDIISMCCRGLRPRELTLCTPKTLTWSCQTSNWAPETWSQPQIRSSERNTKTRSTLTRPWRGFHVVRSSWRSVMCTVGHTMWWCSRMCKCAYRWRRMPHGPHPHPHPRPLPVGHISLQPLPSYMSTSVVVTIQFTNII